MANIKDFTVDDLTNGKVVPWPKEDEDYRALKAEVDFAILRTLSWNQDNAYNATEHYARVRFERSWNKPNEFLIANLKERGFKVTVETSTEMLCHCGNCRGSDTCGGNVKWPYYAIRWPRFRNSK